MRELINGDARLVSGAAVTVGDGIIGTTGGYAFVGIGRGSHVTVNGTPVLPTSDSIDGLTIASTANTDGRVMTWSSGIRVDFDSLFAGLRCGWGKFF
ncbi:hypothetical protein [Burkholderia ambifaria]|uniref:hypothetical protein n=1 Tax=Burkholderia ambifaria TaxID=152480 RepID=UPI002FDFABA2